MLNLIIYFRNRNGELFVVEDKFHYNHQVQLSSYIHGLDEIKPKYGYLLYWNIKYINHYVFFEELDYIEHNYQIKLKKLLKSERSKRSLNQVFNEIQNLIKVEKVDFDRNLLNPNKCGNCVVTRYCGHKTGRFNELEYPYQKKIFENISCTFSRDSKKKVKRST